MLESFTNEGCVAVDLAANGEHGDFAVGQMKVVSEKRSRHHAGNCDEGVRYLFEAEDMPDFDGEGGGFVAK
jgi:hypothetical protein